ncbi:MAG TPA: chromate transporter [Candidatus Cloacimonadota bacterium]|nr:chromate transporter [Candidatus Cloacimonadota bacterium]
MLYLEMLFTFTKIGLFSFGGGYAILAMIQQEVVLKHAWLTESQFVDIVAISQMTPGPIAINAATFIGYQKAGLPGAVLCTLGVILPSLITMLLITISYMKLKHQAWFKNVFARLRLLSIGLIGAAFFMVLGNAVQSLFAVVIFVLSFLATWKLKLNPFTLLILAAIAGMLFAS